MTTVARRPLRILAIYGDIGGCGVYRIIRPYSALRERGHEVVTAPRFEYNSVTFHPAIAGTPWKPDVIVVQRPSNAEIRVVFDVGRHYNIPVVAEFDDLLWNVPGWNPAHRIWHHMRATGQEHSSIHVFMACVRQCDAATVSTDTLAAETRARFPKVPVYVLPNCVDSQAWPPVDRTARWRQDGMVRFGWVGSVTHRMDLTAVAGLLGQACGHMPHVGLVVGGGYRYATEVLGQGFPPERIAMYPWVEMDDLPRLYEPVDVGLAPLDDHKFNHAKSDVKALEYGLSCAPTIASDLPAYRSFVRHGVNGFLCRSVRDWLRALRVLATDHEARFAMGLQARRDAETRDIRRWVSRWEDTLYEIIERKARVVATP